MNTEIREKSGLFRLCEGDISVTKYTAGQVTVVSQLNLLKKLKGICRNIALFLPKKGSADRTNWLYLMRYLLVSHVLEMDLEIHCSEELCNISWFFKWTDRNWTGKLLLKKYLLWFKDSLNLCALFICCPWHPLYALIWSLICSYCISNTN